MVFDIEESQKGAIPKVIRKVYTNTKGIKFFPRINQHHIHLDLEAFLAPVIENDLFTTGRDLLEITHEFPAVVGESSCVKTTDKDQIFYAIRKGRHGHTRFSLNARPKKTNQVFGVFKKVPEGYLIVTIFTGNKAAREPWDPLATKEDLLFWESHALVCDPNKIINDSIVLECPWELNTPAICKVSFKKQTNY